jgi:negative regulator of flagellin synthesis FlgM
VTSKIGSGGVDNRPVQVATDRGVKRVKDAADSSTAQVAKASSGNSGVQITDSARQLAALEQAIRAMPEVDDAKIAEIRNAIEAGTYQVSPERIADKILRWESELS